MRVSLRAQRADRDPYPFENSFISAFVPSSSWRAPEPPKPKHKLRAPKSKKAIPSNPVPPAASNVMLEGMFDGKNLGAFSLSFAAGQLMVSSPQVGGMYAVDALPLGEWFGLAD